MTRPVFDDLFSNRAPSKKVEAWRWRARTTSLLLVVLMVGIWLGVLMDPMVGPFAWFGTLAIGLTLGILLMAIGLSWLGFGLFALGDWVVAWCRRTMRGPDNGKGGGVDGER